MTPEILLAEGKKLIRPCMFLRPDSTGPVAAIWHNRDRDEIDATGFRCWLTVTTSFIPGFPDDGPPFLSVFTDEEKCEGGRIEYSDIQSVRPGIELRATAESVLPPIEAVFARGADVVAQWLASPSWPRLEWYNDNFPDRDVVVPYERAWAESYPLYLRDACPDAVLGGWHWPCADHDWYQLIDEQLLVFTVADSEPWVEAWHLRSGQDRVIQRIS